jgi:hypothetical protein
MYNYCWDYFPARLHSTKEIIFFLENINNIQKIIHDNPSDLTNYIFGGIYHPYVISDSNHFMNKKINRNINNIIIEISSRKVNYYKNIPLNHYYSKNEHRYDLVEKIITDNEIEDDLNMIIKLCKKIYNENIKIHIIPHLNLKKKSDNDYIFERNQFVTLLEHICNKLNIKIHNIGKYIESNNRDSYLDDYMADSTHYSKDYDKIKYFLISKIN